MVRVALRQLAALRAALAAALLLSACGASPQAQQPTSAPASTQAPAPTSAPAATDAPAPTVSPATPAPSPTPATGPQATRDGIMIRRVVETGGSFVRLAVDPVSGAIFSLSGDGRIFRLENPAATDARAELAYRPADIGGSPATAGMAFGPDGTLYVVSNSTDGDNTRAIVRKGVPTSDGERAWSTLAETEPYPRSNTPFDHLFNGIVVSPDGKYVYVNSGSRTDHGEVESNEGKFPDTREVPITSAILRLPADGEDITLPNDEAALRDNGYLFADGTRNAYDLAFDAEGELFATDNGPDADYADELNWLREGQHYGFPWRMGSEDNPQQFADYDPASDRRLQPDFTAVKNGAYHNDPSFPKPPGAFADPIANTGPDADQYRDAAGAQQDSSDQGQSAHTFTPHRSPLGLSFDTGESLPGDYKGKAFMLSWGAAGGTLSDQGRDLLLLEMTKQGDAYQVSATQIASDFDSPIDSVIVAGKLYVLDWGGVGTIWEVSFS